MNELIRVDNLVQKNLDKMYSDAEILIDTFAKRQIKISKSQLRNFGDVITDTFSLAELKNFVNRQKNLSARETKVWKNIGNDVIKFYENLLSYIDQLIEQNGLTNEEAKNSLKRKMIGKQTDFIINLAIDKIIKIKGGNND